MKLFFRPHFALALGSFILVYGPAGDNVTYCHNTGAGKDEIEPEPMTKKLRRVVGGSGGPTKGVA